MLRPCPATGPRCLALESAASGATTSRIPSRNSAVGRTDDLEQRAEADRREVDPPIEVEPATWSPGGQLDWWVKERREWWVRVRSADGRQRWIRAVDLRPVSGSSVFEDRFRGSRGVPNPKFGENKVQLANYQSSDAES
jgi:hypothetical protein